MSKKIANTSVKIAIGLLSLGTITTLHVSTTLAQSATPTPTATPIPTQNANISNGNPQEGFSITKRATAIAAEATRTAQRGP